MEEIGTWQTTLIWKVAFAATHQSPEPFVTRVTYSHSAAAPPQSPSKLRKSEIAAEREKKQRH